jgi:hypothetical protein
MGSNFGDIDNDGYPDIYLATGEPRLETLIPNRLFRNSFGQVFNDVTFSTRTGHLQKGHAVSIGDWNRNGQSDIFVQTGGAGDGDRFYNVMFENPGNENAWLNLQLVGTESNRSAIGARIAVRAVWPVDDDVRTVYKTVSTGSSFGANPLEQMIGLGAARQIQSVEIHWVGSGKRQVFHDLPIHSAIRIYENRDTFEQRGYNWNIR